MTSSLVFTANELNQRINDFQSSFFPIRWCKNKKIWVYGNDQDWKWYLTISFIWKVVVISPMLQFALYSLVFKNHGSFELLKIFHASMLFQTIWGTLFLDFLCWIFGKDIVACCNWCYSPQQSFKLNQNTRFLVTQPMETLRIKNYQNLHESGMFYVNFLNFLDLAILLIFPLIFHRCRWSSNASFRYFRFRNFSIVFHHGILGQNGPLKNISCSVL